MKKNIIKSITTLFIALGLFSGCSSVKVNRDKWPRNLLVTDAAPHKDCRLLQTFTVESGGPHDLLLEEDKAVKIGANYLQVTSSNYRCCDAKGEAIYRYELNAYSCVNKH